MAYKCDKCGKKFEGKGEAEKHEKNCKPKKKLDSETRIKEYKRKCNECGKVWHVLTSREEKLMKDVKSNTCDQQVAACGMCGGNWTALQSSTQAKRNEHALTDELTRLKHCPSCGSGNYEEKEITYKKK